MDHVRGDHKVSEEVQHIKLETLFSALDSDTSGVHRLADVASLRDLK